MSREPVAQAGALLLQFAAIVGNEPASSFVEIRPLDPAGRQWFVPVREVDTAVALIDRLVPKHNVYVGAAPRATQSGKAEAVERIWTLWADCDTDTAVEQLRAFRPLPSIVNRSGSDGHLHAWWPLSQPLNPAHAVRANRRLALALGADRAATDAARIMRPIGSLNHKTKPPGRVECVRCELDTFRAADIISGLPDDAAYAPVPERRRTEPTTNGPGALAGLARVVRDATNGERNRKLNWAAYRAGEHAAAGVISLADAERELLAAAVDIGLGEDEALRTIGSGLSAATERSAA